MTRGAAGVCVVVVASLAVVLGPVRAAAEPVAVVATLAVEAEIRAPGATGWSPARLRGEVGDGGALRTIGIGRAALRTAAGHAVRLGSSSEIAFVAGVGAEGAPLRATLAGGRLWITVKPARPVPPGLEVSAGPVTVRLQGGGVAIRTNADGSVLVRVYHGLAVCRGEGDGPGGERAVRGGEEILVAPGAPGEVRKLTREDAEALWVRWNEEQDASGYGGPPPR